MLVRPSLWPDRPLVPTTGAAPHNAVLYDSDQLSQSWQSAQERSASTLPH